MALSLPAWSLEILRGHPFTSARRAPGLGQLLAFLKPRREGVLGLGAGPGWHWPVDRARGLIIDTRA